jgi:hypothetical protein
MTPVCKRKRGGKEKEEEKYNTNLVKINCSLPRTVSRECLTPFRDSGTKAIITGLGNFRVEQSKTKPSTKNLKKQKLKHLKTKTKAPHCPCPYLSVP